MNGGDTECDGKMGFAGAGSANQDQIVRRFQIVPLGQLLDAGTVQGCFAPVKGCQITMDRDAGGFKLIAQTARLPIGLFGIRQPQQKGLGREGFVARRFGLQFSPSDCHSKQLQGLKPREVIAVRGMIRHG